MIMIMTNNNSDSGNDNDDDDANDNDIYAGGDLTYRGFHNGPVKNIT